jgi:cytochrome P450
MIIEGRCSASIDSSSASPAAIKHVLLDNAANYQKTEITRRILEPGLGRGLVTSEGETWRRHRRTMAPCL